jgi:hypothetical protein
MAQDMISTPGGTDPAAASASDARPPRAFLLNSYQRARILVLLATVLSIILFFWAGRSFDLPVHAREHESLLSQPSPLTAMLVVAVTFILATALGSVVAGRIRFNAGLVAACLGLLALSVRGGTMRSVIHYGLARDSSRLFLRLALETALLGILVGVCWFVLRHLNRTGRILDREGSLEGDALDTASVEFSALGVQIVNTVLGILLLCPTEDKWQCIIGVRRMSRYTQTTNPMISSSKSNMSSS